MSRRLILDATDLGFRVYEPRRQFFDARRHRFAAPKGVEWELLRHLRQIAREVGSITRDRIGAGGLDAVGTVEELLRQYAEDLKPWADTVARRALYLVGTHNLAAWEAQSAEIGRALRSIYAGRELGPVIDGLHRAQVGLITSLPLQAVERAQTIARNAQLEGRRPSTIAQAIRALDKTGDVTESRAVLIARTEIGKANSSFTEARSLYVGAESYFWRGMLDTEERDAHVELEGQLCRWDKPPYVNEAEGAHHPGDIWNCRCFAEPLITKGQANQGAEDRYQAAAREAGGL